MTLGRRMLCMGCTLVARALVARMMHGIRPNAGLLASGFPLAYHMNVRITGLMTTARTETDLDLVENPDFIYQQLCETVRRFGRPTIQGAHRFPMIQSMDPPARRLRL